MRALSIIVITLLAAKPFYARTSGIVQAMMDHFARLTGWQYGLFEYIGPVDAGRVVILMGSGAETMRETAAALRSQTKASAWRRCGSTGRSTRMRSCPRFRKARVPSPCWTFERAN